MRARARAALLSLALVAAPFVGASAQSDPSVEGFLNSDRVSSQRATRTQSLFEYRATASLQVGSRQNVRVTVASSSPNTQIVDGLLSFGDLLAPGSYTSLDTFSFLHDRRFPFDPSDFVFELTFDNTPPVADAGPDQTVALGEPALLDGTGSTDADGQALSFDWQITELPPGSAATLDDFTIGQPSFVADQVGRYVVELVVSDGLDDSLPDAVVIDTANSLPTANAGPDQTAAVGEEVTLDGSGSTDPDGDLLNYSWSFFSAPPGSTATLSNPGAVMPRFTVDLPGSYELELVVSDAGGSSAPDSVFIDTLNSAPVADAGPNQTVRVGETAVLDGSGSSDVDGDPLTFSWSLTPPAGSAAALDDPTAVMPSFLVDLPGSYAAQLVVSDGEFDSVPRNVTITTENSPPVAFAGNDRTVALGLVTLDGSFSSDVDGDPLFYSWFLLSVPPGSAATLSDADTVSPSFTTDLDGDYVAQLIVSDGVLDSVPDTVRIRVDPLPGITAFFQSAIGAGLQAGGSGTLAVENHGGVTVRVEVDDPALAVIAPDATTPGAASLDVVVPDGSRAVPFVVQAIAGQLGSFEVTLSAPGFTPVTRSGSVAAPALIISSLSSSLSTGERDGFVVFTGVPNGAGTGVSFLQGISAVAAAGGVTLTATSSNPAAVDLTLDGATGQQVSLDLEAGDFQIFADANARAPGATTVTVEIPGFPPVAGSSVDVNVDAPDLTAFSRTIGSGLQFSSFGSLAIADHGGVTVRVQSANAGVAIVAADDTTPGSAFIDIVVPDGETTFTYTVQAVGGTIGSTTVTASAPGFDSGSGTIDVVAPGISLGALASSSSVGVNDAFALLLGIPNGAGTGLGSIQRVSAANDLELTVTSSDPGVGDISFGGETGGSVTRTIVAPEFQFTPVFRALAPGTTEVSASIPGFLLVPGPQDVEVTTP